MNIMNADATEMAVEFMIALSVAVSSKRWRVCAVHAAFAALLWAGATSAHAASIYRCADAQGHLAFQDTPCATQARQRKIDLQPLPTIGDPAEVAAHRRVNAASNRALPRRSHGVRKKHSSSNPAREKQGETSWECRAADGEVFYRHARCPGSVPGDGTVRNGYVQQTDSSRSRNRRNAWSRVPVHGRKISRNEACRRIHSAGAAGRDGHARDETVSTYDHLMGRDPCDNG